MEIEDLPIKNAGYVKKFGKSLIVAPHADDESLGCGGVIALLRKYNIEISIVLMTDGTLSHPNSKKYAGEKLRDLREDEFTKAAAILGVSKSNLHFFRCRDRQTPQPDSADFAELFERREKLLEHLQPQTVFVPWRLDSHPDHQAAFSLFSKKGKSRFSLVEYPIWAFESEFTAETGREILRVDIREVLDLKLRAIAVHKSQITDLIDDDPEAFRLSAEVLENFRRSYETFIVADENAAD